MEAGMVSPGFRIVARPFVGRFGEQHAGNRIPPAVKAPRYSRDLGTVRSIVPPQAAAVGITISHRDPSPRTTSSILARSPSLGASSSSRCSARAQSRSPPMPLASRLV